MTSRADEKRAPIASHTATKPWMLACVLVPYAAYAAGQGDFGCIGFEVDVVKTR